MLHPKSNIYNPARPSSLQVLDRILGQEGLGLPLNAALQRRPNQVVEHKRAIHKQCETQHLEPLESLPAKPERHDPDEQSTAGVDSGSRCRGDGARDAKTEEVEATGFVST